MRAAFGAIFSVVEEFAMAAVSFARSLRKMAEGLEADLDREQAQRKAILDKQLAKELAAVE
jgi:hypothetical protein